MTFRPTLLGRLHRTSIFTRQLGNMNSDLELGDTSRRQEATDTHGPAKDEPLRKDIRLLGRLLGEVLREKEGEAVFKVVEDIR